ncbi:MAG: hypothetical protein J6G98_05540 [Bacilli bacterium]|nr:hypothetical protein [Bacilli bacterium]
MNKAKITEELKNYNYNSNIYNYLTDLIDLKYSPFHDLDILDKLKLNKIEYEIIKYNLILKSINALKDFSGIKIVNTNDKLNIFTSLIDDYKIIEILFLKKIQINLYDRTNLITIYNSTNLELIDLENNIAAHSYYDNINKDEIKLLNFLISKTNQLKKLLKDKNIISMDKVISDKLEIPKNKGIIVGMDTLYKTEEIYSNSKLLVYKDYLYK